MTEDEQTLVHNMPSHMTETAVTCDKPYRQYAKVDLYNAYGFQHDVYDGVNYRKRFHHNNGLRIGGRPSQSTFQHRSFAFDMISNDLFLLSTYFDLYIANFLDKPTSCTCKTMILADICVTNTYTNTVANLNFIKHLIYHMYTYICDTYITEEKDTQKNKICSISWLRLYLRDKSNV
jgi:hypothetical protein